MTSSPDFKASHASCCTNCPSLFLTLMSAITVRGSLIKILTGLSDLNVMLSSPLLDNRLGFLNKTSKNLIMDSIKHQIEGAKIKT